MPKFKDFAEISSFVRSNGDVVTVSMGELRDAAHAGKLGKYVKVQIVNELSSHGIGYLPEGDLPDYQEHQVRLYRKGSPAGRLIDAVLKVGPVGDKHIREATEVKPSEVLDKIRALVCDE